MTKSNTISTSTVNRIKDVADIYDVVSAFLPLRKTGIRWTAICPFHEDRHDGNFIVYPKDNCFKCFTCGEKGGPIDFVIKYLKCSFADAVRWLGNRYGISTDGSPIDIKVPVRQKPIPLPMLRLPMEMVTAREDTSNDMFCNWLRSLPWDRAQRARVEESLKAYHVGHSIYGHTIWWQIDDALNVRTGKMMRYKADGHRDRETRGSFDWIHSRLFRDERLPQYDEKKMEMAQCLFGLHLIDAYGNNAAVHLVESEKTAVIMSIAYGNHTNSVWMACGGIENISREKLLPIISRKRRIYLYPDRDGIDKWQLKAKALCYDKVTVDTTPVTKWWKESDGEKADIADVVLRMVCENNPRPDPVGDIVSRHPDLKRLDLELVNE